MSSGEVQSGEVQSAEVQSSVLEEAFMLAPVCACLLDEKGIMTESLTVPFLPAILTERSERHETGIK